MFKIVGFIMFVGLPPQPINDAKGPHLFYESCESRLAELHNDAKNLPIRVSAYCERDGYII